MGLIELWLPSVISGAGAFLIYNTINKIIRSRDNKKLYERSHLYAMIMEDRRVRGETLDDLSTGFQIRDRWYNLKGIKFEDKVLLILAGYRVEEARAAHSKIGHEELKVQAHLRTGYSSTNN